MDLLFDTCFLIDLERELIKTPGPAHEFLETQRSSRAWITWTIAGEFIEGFGDIEDAACKAMLSRFNTLPMDRFTACKYAQITRYLRQKSLLIGANDLWIAAAACSSGFSLVTNNKKHFGRILGLQIIDY
jgi:predicted nucleic acid-binding protein